MNTKTTLVLALVAAVAAGYVLLVDKPWQEQEASVVEVKTAAVALFEPRFEDPDRIEIQRIDGKKLVFLKDDQNKWQMTSPMEVPAMETQVRAIIDKVADIKYVRKYGAGDADRPTKEVTGFDQPKAVVRLFKADKELANVTVGTTVPTGKGNFVKIAGSVNVKEDGKELTVTEKDILEVRSAGSGDESRDLSDVFNNKLANFRDRNVLRYDMNDVQRIKVEGDRNFVVVKSGEQWVIESPIRGRADKTKTESIARSLSGLYAGEFVDDDPANPAAYGFDPARMKITIETQKRIPPKAKPGDPDTQPADIEPSTEQVDYVLELGGPTEGGKLFAKLGGKPWVFTIPEYSYKPAVIDVPDLQDKKIAPIDSGKVKAVKLETPDGAMGLTRNPQGKWIDESGNAADLNAVEDLLKSVSGLEAANYIDPNSELIKIDWGKPRARVEITEEGSLNPVTVLVGPASASGKMVFVKNAAEQPVAAVPSDATAALLLGPISYRDRMVMRFERARIKKAEIAQTGKDPIVLTQSQDQWSMVSPIAASIDRDAIRNLMQNLSSLSAKQVVSEGDKDQYGLNTPAVKLAVYVEPPPQPAAAPAETQPDDAGASEAGDSDVTEASNNTAMQIQQIEQLIESQKQNPEENPQALPMLEERLAKLKQQAEAQAVGQDAAAVAEPIVIRMSLAQKDGKTYAAVEGNSLVFEIDNTVFADATAEFHDRQVTRYESSRITEVGITGGKETITLRKTGDDWKYLLDPVLPIDKDRVTRVLDELKDIRTHKYISYAAADLAKYGLDSPANKVELVMDGGERIEVLISAKGPEDDADKSVYAAIGGQNKVFLLKPNQVGRFDRKLEDFEKSATAGSPDGPGGMGGPMMGGPGGIHMMGGEYR